MKQKLNTKSSTEAELCSTDYIIPEILWTRYFLKAQCYKNFKSVMSQDNKSVILFEKNRIFKQKNGQKKSTLDTILFKT